MINFKNAYFAIECSKFFINFCGLFSKSTKCTTVSLNTKYVFSIECQILIGYSTINDIYFDYLLTDNNSDFKSGIPEHWKTSADNMKLSIKHFTLSDNKLFNISSQNNVTLIDLLCK